MNKPKTDAERATEVLGTENSTTAPPTTTAAANPAATGPAATNTGATNTTAANPAATTAGTTPAADTTATAGDSSPTQSSDASVTGAAQIIDASVGGEVPAADPETSQADAPRIDIAQVETVQAHSVQVDADDEGHASGRQNAVLSWARVRKAWSSFLHLDVPDSATPLRRWEMRVEGPMMIISVIFLLLYVIIALRPMHPTLVAWAEAGMWVTWAAFAVDYCVRLTLAKPRWRWFLRHLHELLLVVLPWFRPLRVLRIIPALLYFERFSAASRRVSVAMYAVAGSIMLMVVAALTFYDAEIDAPGSQIDGFGDALWWAAVTITTVGYGDITPVTPFGRVVGICVMAGGIAMAGVATATIASWLIEMVDTDASKESADRDERLHGELMAELKELHSTIDQLNSEITKLHAKVESMDKASASHNMRAELHLTGHGHDGQEHSEHPKPGQSKH